MANPENIQTSNIVQIALDLCTGLCTSTRFTYLLLEEGGVEDTRVPSLSFAQLAHKEQILIIRTASINPYSVFCCFLFGFWFWFLSQSFCVALAVLELTL